MRTAANGIAGFSHTRLLPREPRRAASRLAERLKRSAARARTILLDTAPGDVPRLVPSLAAAALLASAGVYGAAVGGHGATMRAAFHEHSDAALAGLGFRISAVTFDGLAELTEGELLAMLTLDQSASLTHFDTDAAKATLLAHPWIAHTELQRFFPNRLHVTVKERQAAALLQRDILTVIDADGRDLGPLVDPSYNGLPVLAGEGAHLATADVTPLFDAVRGLPSAPRGAVRVSGRRWNVVLASGVTLQLPADDIPAAMRHLRRAAGADLADWLLGEGAADRIIDLRYPNHIAMAHRESESIADETIELAENAP